MSGYLIKGITTYDAVRKQWLQKDVAIFGSTFCIIQNLTLIPKEQVKTIDAHGKVLLPGIVDLHNDEIENYIAPKRNTFFCDSDVIDKLMIGCFANGITLTNLAVTYSAEPGIRNADNTYKILRMLKEYKKSFRFGSCIKINLRVEMNADWRNLLKIIDEFSEDIDIVTFCDHSPYNVQNWSPQKYRRYISSRCKIGDDDFISLIKEMSINKKENRDKQESIFRELKARRILIGVHDISYASEDSPYVDFGEFPTNFAVIDYLRSKKKPVLLGTPNIRNGRSINNNISVLEACKDYNCDILCSDYDRNSMLKSMGILNSSLDECFYESYKYLSENPARLLGLNKGIIAPGYEADCIIVDKDFDNPRVYKTIVGGEVAYESCF